MAGSPNGFEVCPGCPYGTSETATSIVMLRSGGVVSDPLTLNYIDGVPTDPFGRSVLFIAGDVSAENPKIKIIGEAPTQGETEAINHLNVTISTLVRGISACSRPSKSAILRRPTCPTLDGYKTPRPVHMDDEFLLSREDIHKSYIVPVHVRGMK